MNRKMYNWVCKWFIFAKAQSHMTSIVVTAESGIFPNGFSPFAFIQVLIWIVSNLPYPLLTATCWVTVPVFMPTMALNPSRLATSKMAVSNDLTTTKFCLWSSFREVARYFGSKATFCGPLSPSFSGKRQCTTRSSLQKTNSAINLIFGGNSWATGSLWWSPPSMTATTESKNIYRHEVSTHRYR